MRHSGRRPAVNPVPLGDATWDGPRARPPDRRGDLRTRLPGSGAPPGPWTGPPDGDLPVESVVTATERARWSHGLDATHRAIVELARRPVSLVEIGAVLTVPVP
jgi:hypothetical protein